MVNELWGCHLPPFVKKQGNLIYQEKTTTQTDGVKMGDHEISEIEKIKKMASSSPQFSNFWFKALGDLITLRPLHSSKGPCILFSA